MPVERAIRARPDVPKNVRSWFFVSTRKNHIPPVYVREWLGDVVRSSYRIFYSIAYGYFRNPSYAEDVVQTAVVKALQNLGGLKNPEAIVGWIAVIVRNTCLDLLRHKDESSTESLEEADQVPGPNRIPHARLDEQRLLLAAMNRLPENQAIVVRLRFLEDCDIAEIAERLGLRRNTVEVRLHRALENLAKDASLTTLKGGYL